MTGTPSYTVRQQTIGAGGYVTITRAGDFVTCLDSSASFKVSFDGGPESDFEDGLTIRPTESFRSLRLHNPGGAAMTVRLGIGRGDFADNRFIPAQAIDVEEVSPDTFQSPAPVSVGATATAQLVAADTSRVEVAVRNLSTSDRIWVQDAASPAAEGWPLDAKEGVVLTTSAAVYAYNPNAGAIDVAIFETKRSA